MQIDLFLTDAHQQIERHLSQLVSDPKDRISVSARYSLLAPAKRMRPLLLLATVASYGKSIQDGFIPACALELIHTYSLIHDDLPCMDDDDLRRGKPTLHKAFPEWHALLTGDYLLTYAFELLSTAPYLDDSQRLALIHLFSKEAGSKGMIGGQMIDLLSQNSPCNWPVLEEMHAKKTASLIIAALEGGAIIAKAPRKDLEILREIGKNMGIAFQLVDDVLDTTGTVEELGKPIGSDTKLNKATAVSILGIEQTQKIIASLYKQTEELCSQLQVSSDLLKRLFDKMIHRHK